MQAIWAMRVRSVRTENSGPEGAVSFIAAFAARVRNASFAVSQPVRLSGCNGSQAAIAAWIAAAKLSGDVHLFPSPLAGSPHLSTRHYARIVKSRVALIGANPRKYRTHPLHRTKATLIYRRTKNLRAAQTVKMVARFARTI